MQDAAADGDAAARARELTLSGGSVLRITERQHDDLDGEPGGVVWDAALVLAHYMSDAVERGQLSLAGARVVELGAGTGCAGLAAAALGAAEVVLTDRPQLMPLLQRNIQLNGLQDVARNMPLEWGESLPPQLCAPAPAAAALRQAQLGEQHAARAAGQQVQQQQARQHGTEQQQQQQQQPPPPPSSTRCDLVLCADCIYSPASVPALLTTLRQLLCVTPDAAALVACEMRSGAGLELFHAALPGAGLADALVPLTELHPDWCSPDILVWRITRAPVAAAARA